MVYSNPDLAILRTPLFPFDKIFTAEISNLLHDLVFKEAIFLSSPDLFAEMERYSNGAVPEKNSAKLSLSLYRYWLRACYRCTPFGLFAGLSMGNFSGATKIELASSHSYKKNTRLDTHFLSSFVQKIVADEEVKACMKWYPNNTIYTVFDKLRYIKYHVDKYARTHNLSSVSLSGYVLSVLTNAEGGATLGELAATLVRDDITVDEATDFVREMIDECLLISGLEPRVTGTEYHHQLIQQLTEIPSAHTYLTTLISLVNKLGAADEKEIGTPHTLYQDVLAAVKNSEIEFDPGKLLQCDLYKPAKIFQVNNVIKKELNDVIALLTKTTALQDQSNLEKFKAEFLKRYESGEVPLLEILDAEAGIGYPANQQLESDNSPLLADIFLNSKEQPSFSNRNNKWTTYLFKKTEQAIRNSELEIEITEKEISSLFSEDNSTDVNALPDSAFTLCSILSSSENEIGSGNFSLFHSVTSGPSAANLLGRFCHLSNDLSDRVVDLMDREENLHPDRVFAEILHIPAARLGNILMRPVLRKYEIPILTVASVDKEHTLLLDDLMVSVKADRVYLRSKRLNKEIVPRLTTAHNFSMNPVPHYHFLCDLQFQRIKAGLAWDWGTLNNFSFLPRVRYGKTILSKARWLLTIEDVTARKDTDDAELTKLLPVYFKEKGIARTVTISEGDNQLPIDIENHACQQILAQALKKSKSLTLEECLFNHDTLVVRGAEGSFTNEIIVPWVKSDAAERKFQPATLCKEDVIRSFTPGTRWHYMKIYCGVKTADSILVEVIKPVTEELLQSGIVDKFFFIRYADPDHHIRVRFYGDDNSFVPITNLLNEKIKPYVENNLVWKIQTDTYVREIERYGSHNMENSESLFFIDSVATLQVISLLEGDEGDELRWVLAIKGVHDMLNSFRLDLDSKRALMLWISTSFLQEFNADNTDFKKQLSGKYRNERSKIELALTGKLDESHELFHVWEIFKERQQKLSLCADQIHERIKEDNLEKNMFELLSSYIHMFLNRFLRSKQRLQEMVIYDLLHQHYKSLLAREGKKITAMQSEAIS